MYVTRLNNTCIPLYGSVLFVPYMRTSLYIMLYLHVKLCFASIAEKLSNGLGIFIRSNYIREEIILANDLFQ